MIAALEAGFFRREIADAAFAYQREVDARRKLIVGVNAFVEPDEKPIDTLVIDDGGGEGAGRATAAASRRSAMPRRCSVTLDEMRRVAATKTNLMPALLEAAGARCTVGEMMNAMADVFGRYDGAARW